MMNNLAWVSRHRAKFEHKYRMYRRYYEGKHPFFDTRYDSLEGKPMLDILRKIKDNLCKRVINAKCSRLKFTGFDSDIDTTNEMLDVWYTSKSLRDKAALINKYALIYGDAFALLWPDENNELELCIQNPTNFAVLYDDDGETITSAVKYWPEDINKVVDEQQVYESGTVLRINVYDATSVRRYTCGITVPSDESMLQPYEDDGYPFEIPNPFGMLPVVHFGLGIEPWDYAHSDLEDVVSLQDKLNNTEQDLYLITHQLAFPQRYMSGLEGVYDPSNRKIDFTLKSSPNEVWLLPEDVNVGQFPAADIKPLIDVTEAIRTEICRVSSTPAHLLTIGSSNFPSGEALKTAEAPLLDAIEIIQQKWEYPWVQLATIACKFVGIDPGNISVQWQDVTPHSDKDQAETATLKLALGWSEKQLQRDMGLSDATIEKMADEKSEEVAQSSANLANTFNRGGSNA